MSDLAALAASGELAQMAEPTKGFPVVDPVKWTAEQKWDGWRVLAVVHDDRVSLHARNGNTYSDRLPAVAAELAALPAGTVLDGEAVAVDGKWGDVQSVMTTLGGHAVASMVSFMVFDLIAHGGIDARSLPYERRRALLEQLFVRHADDFSAVKLTPQLEPVEASFAKVVEQGGEGLILKRLDAPYASGKRDGYGWKKAKATTRIDVVVTGFTPGQNGFTGLVGAMTFGQHDPETGELVARGKCSGMNMKTRIDMTKRPEKYVGRVVEISHLGVNVGNGESGKFRSPNFKRVRSDRTPESVVLHDA